MLESAMDPRGDPTTHPIYRAALYKGWAGDILEEGNVDDVWDILRDRIRRTIHREGYTIDRDGHQVTLTSPTITITTEVDSGELDRSETVVRVRGDSGEEPIVTGWRAVDVLMHAVTPEERNEIRYGPIVGW